jgi:predicted nicotinamide N-methyase
MTEEYVEETIDLAGCPVTLVRPASADELIDEEAFDEDEFLPYWAELWPSGVALARAVAALDLRGVRVLELGAGLGLPSLAAALGGAHVLATDWADEAVELLRLNASRNALGAGRNRIGLRAQRVRWDMPEPLIDAAPWPLVLGADLLYERRNADRLLELLPRLGADVLLADPGRPFAKGFLERASVAWTVETTADALLPSGGLYRLRLR